MSALQPSPLKIARLVGTLVDKPVRVTSATASCVAGYVALYTDDAGRDAFACFIDCTLVAVLGAALALVPARVAAEEARTGRISELLLSNAYEVLNVLSAAFNEQAPPCGHVRLRALRPISDVPAQVASASKRTELDVTVTSYPTGKLAIVVFPN